VDYEKAIITKAVKAKKLLTILNAGISPKHFFNKKLREIFEYVIDAHKQDGSIPSSKELALKYNFTTIDTSKFRTAFVIDEFKENFKRVAMMEILKDGHHELTEGDPTDALKILNKGIQDFSSEFTLAKDIDLSTVVLDVKKDCAETRQAGGVSGIKSPWAEFDKVSGGFNPEDMIVLCSRPKVGKTWLTLFIASFCTANGKKALFVSKDMTSRYLKRRYIGLRSKVPYPELKSGFLTTKSQLKMTKVHADLQKEKDQFILIEDDLSTDTGVNFIDAKVHEHQPDIVFIDGVYLLADDGGLQDERPRLRAVSRDIKKMARRRKVPVFVVHQITRDKASKKTGEAGASGFYGSDGFFQDADLALELICNKDLRMEGARRLKIVGSREGEELSLKITFDLDHYDFSILENEEDEDEEEQANI